VLSANVRRFISKNSSSYR